ncbi:MAG: hypothetical protein NTU94_11580 [Planctomycetota bacterium]|nr:hypothetical protein [Planctomycetota bacterium]
MMGEAFVRSGSSVIQRMFFSSYGTGSASSRRAANLKVREPFWFHVPALTSRRFHPWRSGNAAFGDRLWTSSCFCRLMPT